MFFISFLMIFYFSSSEEILSKYKPNVVINEICTNNKNSLLDSYGEYSPWIELYNFGKNTVDISGYGLSNEVYIPFKWTFPQNTIINSNEYLIVFISDKKSINDELHTNFELDINGDILFFSNKNAELIEKIEIPKLKENESYGRITDTVFKKMTPTPKTENEILIEPPIFSKESGFYEEEFLLILSSSEGTKIYYTIDGSDPLNSSTSKIYKEPIKIYDRSSEPNFYAEIGEEQNSPLSIGSMGGGYKRPNYLLDKPMVVRACSKNNERNSIVISHTYFVTTGNLAQYQDFTVVSLVTNPENLFDPDKGIYVVGNEYVEAIKKNNNTFDFKKMWELMRVSNFYKEGPEWEKETNIAIFEKGKISLQQNLGIKIRGFSTRMQPGKSFNVYAKKRFGKKSIKNVLFPNNYDMNHNLIDKYKSFALRNVFAEERIKDEFANKLLHERREYQSITDTKKCILFLNGEYWGFYVMIEKFSENYIQSHFNVPGDYVTLIKEGELANGDQTEFDLYNNFMHEYSEKDLLDEKIYEEVKNFIDFDSFIEHFVIGIYLGTLDWPGHNDGVWRYNGEKIENNKYSDGRWRYISFDFDYTMGASFSMWGQDQKEGYAIDNLKGLEMRKNIPTILFLPLLKNEDFRNQYILRFCDYVNEVFSIDKIDALIDDYKDNYLDMLAHGEVRWKGFTYSNELEAFANYKNNYITHFDNIKKFFVERPKYALQHMKEYFNLIGELQEIIILKKGEGKIKINTIITGFKEEKWIGRYFSNIPITITAIPSEKSEFKGWSGDVSSNEISITIDLNKNTTINAIFETIN
jgi:hypothetical protein